MIIQSIFLKEDSDDSSHNWNMKVKGQEYQLEEFVIIQVECKEGQHTCTVAKEINRVVIFDRTWQLTRGREKELSQSWFSFSSLGKWAEYELERNGRDY